MKAYVEVVGGIRASIRGSLAAFASLEGRIGLARFAGFASLVRFAVLAGFASLASSAYVTHT